MGRSRRRVTTIAIFALTSLVHAAAPEPDALRLPESALTGQRGIVHALNRLAFGPRPGEVERVRRIGLERWIEQQLDPDSIEDPELERRLAPLTTVATSTAERLAAFPPRQLALTVGRSVGSQLPQAERERLLPEIGDFVPRDSRADRKDARQSDPRKRAVRREVRREAPGPRVVSDELAQAKLIRAIYGERQLEEVMTDFWFNHFNVDVGKGAVRWWATDYERNAIRPHALGRFRDLLGATARHPAMLYYLDNWLSSSADGGIDLQTMQIYAIEGIREQGLPPGGVATLLLNRRGMDTGELERRIARRDARREARRERRGETPPIGRELRARAGLNENYARELLELHTLGVDGGYTQRDIVEVARCFTGWTLLPLQAGQTFVYIDELHDRGTKTVLGQRIESGGVKEGERVLDLLARHPSTARFVSAKLARRFVSDDPPPALIERMAATFRETDGDIRAVLRTLFASPEFWSPAAERAKLKTPFEFVVSAARATGAELSAAPASPPDPSRWAAVGGGDDVTGEVEASSAGDDTMTGGGDAMTGGGDAMTGGGDAMMDAGHRPRHDGAQGLVRLLFGMGQPLYGCAPPTGYPDRAEDWISVGALLQRMKIALGLASGRFRGVETDVTVHVPGGELDDEALAALARGLTGRDPSEATLAAIRDQLSLSPEELEALGVPARFGRSSLAATKLAAGWILASAEFQRR